MAEAAMVAEQSEQVAPVAAHDLVVHLDGFDGPLYLLLNLAQEQKVDLGTISILALAEQYLTYIQEAKRLRFEIAADYLVMAAWLAYLKSRLLLPSVQEDEPNPAELAEALRFQLLRLEAMQKAAEKLLALPQLGTEIFTRGIPEPVQKIERPVYHLPLYDLMQSLAAPARRNKTQQDYKLPEFKLFSLESALQRVRNMLGFMPEWAELQSFMPETLIDPLEARSAIASTFAASLEMVKMGEIIIRQDGTFAPIFVRKNSNPVSDFGDEAVIDGNENT